jgi:cytochrome c biogenesis protein CcmG, thiol:disulfide interchange protein DsbE
MKKVMKQKSHPARLITLAVGVVAVGLAVLLASQVNVKPQFAGGDLIDKPVPTFNLPALDGNGRIRSDDLQGKVVLVNFWNSWCIPCQQEHHALETFYASHAKDPDFEMIGIVRDDTTKAARAYVAEHHDAWQFATDPNGQATLGFGTTGQPESYMIAPNGIVVGLFRSAVSVSDLEEMLSVARKFA